LDRSVAFIFARGGSKGLPGKNIKTLNGKPLIAWTIECALQSNRFDHVFVSTDDVAIAKVAGEWGAKIPFMRPPELAQDDSPEWLSWQHASRWIKENYPECQRFVSLPATSPLRSVDDINNAFKIFDTESDLVLGVSATDHNPLFNVVTKDDVNRVSLWSKTDTPIYRRQDAPQAYNITTILYMTTVDHVISANGVFDGRVKAIDIPSERSVDIDTLQDFQWAEFLMKNKGC